MERFDIFHDDEKSGYLLNVQSELIMGLNTTVVVPLVKSSLVQNPITYLNPVFQISDETFVMRTQFISAVPISSLKERAGNLARAHTEIINALDMLFSGV